MTNKILRPRGKLLNFVARNVDRSGNRRKMMTEASISGFSVNREASSKGIEEYAHDVKAFIPKLSPELHKGQCGRIGVVGGSLEYTGAPYFAAVSTMKLGADLAYVFCCRDAAPVIKSYSPELIVYPFLDDARPLSKMSACLQRLHSLVIGPGLGRDPGVLDNVEAIIKYCNSEMKSPLPLIIDADGLYLITEKVDLVRTYKGPVILTPNAAEYSRLCQKLSVEESEIASLAEDLKAVIVRKGVADVICNGLQKNTLKVPTEDMIITCSVPGSDRRCGGQGDILSGCTAVFVAWFMLSKYKNADFTSAYDSNSHANSLVEHKNMFREKFFGFSLACLAACSITRHCSGSAFKEHGRSMTSSDMIPLIHKAFQQYFPTL